MPSVTYYFVTGQMPNPCAVNVHCDKHGKGIWAVCDCHPLYFANIHRKYSTPNEVEYDDIDERRTDFVTLSAANKWANKEIARLNKA